METNVDLSGLRIKHLTVLSISFTRNEVKYWRCLCQCGNVIIRTTASLTEQGKVSCGCIRGKFKGEAFKPYHDKYRQVWSNMIARCTNPKRNDYHNYGGRGITVCERWINSFDAFMLDVGRAPERHLTIERKDNNKGYEPGNVRWVTRDHQANNKRNNINIEYLGYRKTLAQWCRFLGVEYSGTWKEIRHYKVEPKQALRNALMRKKGIRNPRKTRAQHSATIVV